MRSSAREVAVALWGGIWALLFPVFLLLGLRMGVFTPSEIGAFAVVYLVVGFAAYRKLTRTSFLEALESSLADVGSVMFLIALLAIVSYGIVYEQVPDRVAQAMLGVTDSLEGVMILVVIFLLIAGFVIDSTVLIIMLTPTSCRSFSS